MSVEIEDDDVGFVRKKRVMPSTEVDITPMIDLTFQLLIFFMVRSSPLSRAGTVTEFLASLTSSRPWDFLCPPRICGCWSFFCIP